LLTLGVALPFFMPTFIAIFISAVVGGTGFILAQVSMQTLTGALGDGEARTKNFSYYLLAVASADFVGPVLAGFSIDAVGHVKTYALCAAPALFSIAGFAALDRLIPHAHGGATKNAAHGLRDLFRERDLRRVLLTSAVTLTAADLFQLYVPLYSHSIGLSASVIGLVMGAAAAAVFVTRAVLPPMARVVGEERLLLTAAMFALIPLFVSAIALGVVCFVLGLGLGLGQPLTMILAYNRSPAGRAGEVVGMRVAINSFTHVVIPPVFGAVGSLLGLVPVLWGCAGVVALGAYKCRVPVRVPRELQEAPPA
jgi:MFS family permease